MRSSRIITVAITLLLNASSLQRKFTRVVHEGLLMPVLMYRSETMVWIKKERSRIRAVQMNNLRSFLGIDNRDRK